MPTRPAMRALVVAAMRAAACPVRGAALFVDTKVNRLIARRPDGDIDLEAFGRLPTTKGDVAVYNGSKWVRLGVGANGTTLTADSTTASGVKWA